MSFYSIIYKPYMVLSQFMPADGKKALKDFFDVPKDVYAVGRLDHDSEGLLVLTNDKRINHLLLDPSFAHEREYWVQVDGAVNEEAIKQLQQGVIISVDGKQHHTKPATAFFFNEDPIVPNRDPPIRFRKNIPAPWISLQLTEGKNRQVRKMTAAVGYPTLRLIRYRISNCTIEGLQPGEMKQLSSQEFHQKIFGRDR